MDSSIRKFSIKASAFGNYPRKGQTGKTIWWTTDYFMIKEDSLKKRTLNAIRKRSINPIPEYYLLQIIEDYSKEKSLYKKLKRIYIPEPYHIFCNEEHDIYKIINTNFIDNKTSFLYGIENNKAPLVDNLENPITYVMNFNLTKEQIKEKIQKYSVAKPINRFIAIIQENIYE